MKKCKSMRRRVAGVAALIAGVAIGADYAWLANPINAQWLDAANWSPGEWQAAASNTATFDSSATRDVDVNGDVVTAGVTVNNGDYTFTNGSITVNGAFNVGEGASATVYSTLKQDSEATRFDKTGAGTLIVKGDASATNTYHRFALHGGATVLDGGVHLVTGLTTAPGDSGAMVSLSGAGGKSSTLTLTGGARFVCTTNSKYIANSGCDIVVTDNSILNTYNLQGEFLHGFQDNIGNSGTRRSSLTIENGGTVVANQLRIGKLSTTRNWPDYARTYLNAGGRFFIHHFTIDSGNSYKARMDFDGGMIIHTNTPAEIAASGSPTIVVTGVDGCWRNAELYLREGGLWIKASSRGAWYYNAPFLSEVEHDGGIHITNSISSTTYIHATNSTYNGGLWLHGAHMSVNNDRSFGAVPAEPTNNVFFMAGSRENTLHFARSFNTAPTRSFYVGTNLNARIGVNHGHVAGIRGVFNAETSSVLNVVSDWSGKLVLDPGAGNTNKLGSLKIYGNLSIASGVTEVLRDTGVGAEAGASTFYVCGNNSNFNPNNGVLSFDGGELRVPQFNYLTVHHYAQVFITNGHFNVPVCREYLNGLGSPARTLIGGNGTLTVPWVRISQTNKNDENGDPLTGVTLAKGGTINTKLIRIDRTHPSPRGYFDFDGGTLAAQANNNEFIGCPHNADANVEKWTNIHIRVCSGGAVIDSGAYNITVRQPLWSHAEHDGGLTKKGAGTLTMANLLELPGFEHRNTYNGPTRVERGTLEFVRDDGGFPGGDVEIVGHALTNSAPPLVVMPTLNFRAGCGVRIVDADLLDGETFGGARTFLTVTEPMASVPPVSFVSSTGAVLGTGNGWKGWTVKLGAGGKSLTFRQLRGTVLLFR